MATFLKDSPAGAVRVRSPSVEIDESTLIEELVECFPEECLENRSLVVFAAAFMLMYRNYDVARAKDRCSNYLRWRKEIFGNLAYHTIEDDETLAELISTCVMQTIIPPVGVKAPVLLYIQMKVHDSGKYTAIQVIKCMHFLIMAAIRRDLSIASEGFSIVSDLSNAEYKNFDIDIGRHVAMAVKDVLPLRIVQAVVYNAPIVFHYLVGIVTLFFPEKLQKRIKSVTEGDGEVFEGSDMPVSMIPEALGGTYVVSTPENHLKYYQDLNCSA